MTESAIRGTGPWQDARLVCGIGHQYRGRWRSIERLFHDMDGEQIWQPETQYDADRCVVCGLLTWGLAPTGVGAKGDVDRNHS